jgi:crotonobetainyl-CoA:carnitine CoA-transferase CaiB-like acyl-CoA transferase
MQLGAYGVDVIKVEPPDDDRSRYFETTYGSIRRCRRSIIAAI